MTTLQLITLVLGIAGVCFAALGGVVSLIAIATVLVARGREQQRIVVLERRVDELAAAKADARAHNELARFAHEGIQSLEHRMTDGERWQSAADAKLDGIRADLVELKTIVTAARKR